MSIQKFPTETVKKIRQYVQDTLSLDDSERQLQTWTGLEEDLPEPESIDDLSGVFTFGGLSAEDVSTPNLQGHWFVSTVNPGAALLKLPGLQVKPEFRLISYLYREEQDGVGLVLAVPEPLSTMAQLEKALRKSGTLAQPPKPEGALPHFMEAIQGDRSPLSFLIASVLRRELQEFGATGKRCVWRHHRFIDSIPPQAKCSWRVDQPPKDLSIKAKIFPDGQAAVEFFSYRVGENIQVYRHLDQYPVGSYKPASMDKGVAVIQR